MAWIAAIIGLGTAAYGASQNKKAAGSNDAAAAQARSDELKRRAAAQKELKRAYDAYNELREERPGVSFEQWKNEYVKGITDPALAEAFRRVKEDDFVFSQKLADLATAANIESFERTTDSISGGAYNELRDTQNEIALTSDTDSAVKRAMEIRSALIPAGSVRTDSQGRFVEGQRADKQVFTTAYEQDLAARDRQFRMSRDLSNDYATLAERQQERARDFINFGSVEPVARGFVTQAIQNSVAFQQQDEQNQFQLIRDYANAVYSNQTQTPQFQNPNAYNNLISSGIESAIKGLAQYQNDQNKSKQGQGLGSSTGSYI